MKTLVIYQSSTGFTQKYANWIAEELSSEAKELKKVTLNDLQNADRIIFGGWIMGGMIMGLDKIRKMNPKNLVVFAVGASADREENRKNLITQNNLSDIPLYYFEGGLAFERMKFLPRTVLKMMGKSIAKKENKTPQDIEMEKIFLSLWTFMPWGLQCSRCLQVNVLQWLPTLLTMDFRRMNYIQREYLP